MTPTVSETTSEQRADGKGGEFVTQAEILACHAEFGRLNWHMVKKAMGPNWPAEWEALGPGEAIFEPDEDRRP